MAKYKYINNFSKETQEDLFLLLVDSVAGAKKTDAAKLLRDLLSEQEASMLARRLKIALLLEKGWSYEDIRKAIKVSHSTIAKIQLWLKTYGDGFRMAIPKIESNAGKSRNEDVSPGSWRSLKKRYPMYFWPELLLKEIVRSANMRERERLLNVLSELKDKTPLTKEIQNILNKKSNTT
jgi:uncharacterized protein YerC